MKLLSRRLQWVLWLKTWYHCCRFETDRTVSSSDATKAEWRRFLCHYCIWLHLATISFHWVKIFPSVKQLCILENVIKSSIDIGVNSNWVNFKFWVNCPHNDEKNTMSFTSGQRDGYKTWIGSGSISLWDKSLLQRALECYKLV